MNLGVLSPKLLRIMPLLLQYFWIIPLCMGTIITVVETEQTTNFMWNKSNPMFQAVGGAKLTVAVGTNLVIKCPYKTVPEEYYRIYWVSELGYRDCFRPANASKIMVICDRPNTSFEFVQEISTFTGVPGGKDFEIGKSYYLASFSTGTQNGLANDINGACTDYNMKLNLTVVAQIPPTTPGPIDTEATTRKPETSTPKPTTRAPETTTTQTTTTSTETTTIKTTQKPQSTNIPVSTDIPVINVPDNPSNSGNTGVIDITNSARTSRATSVLQLSLCLSLLHILYLNLPYIQR